ncbi:glycosyltransferase family 2 protein [Nocardia brasiliensis]|uniref:glycosyltransferase family 2 protein n=1 Tax=Nocardia brasiliensis TaxID=37326 RepID=UPI00142E0D7A|nr:glycosyltransferase family A protein [Nocardia brasiliensis]
MTEWSISIVIPTHIRTVASRDLLDVQLDALLRQDFSGDFEVVIADNGSPVPVADHIERHPLRDRLRLVYVDASGSSGAAHARNVGAAHATGEILLFCDHDDRVYPNWVRRMVEFLDTGYDLTCSAVEGDSLNTDNPREFARIPAPEEFQPPGVYAPVIIGTSMACRAAVYRKLGGQDSSYAANEDLEFGWRAHREGYRLGYLAEALVAYRYRKGFRPGYRQGRSRGIGLARVHGEYPNNGLPEIRLRPVLSQIVRVPFTRGLVAEERGLMFGLAVGQFRGGLRYRTLRWA